ncbi:MAG: TIGR00159 family protein [Candidatus Aminicenantes bacterium]|nr:TIGR00159 family protein [Candidatus Aminicenantes bacterium]
MFSEVLAALHRATLRDFIDILLVAFILYSFLRLIRESRAYQMAVGLGLVGLFLLATRWLKFTASNWLIENFAPYLIFAVIVLFQQEIRRFLTGLGARTIRKPLALRSFKEKLEDLCRAVEYMSRRKIGALIAIENEISLSVYAGRGTSVRADLSKDLLVSIFMPHSPLHDGAVIIRGNRIEAAGCLLPLPSSHQIRAEFPTRTRHLAAIGLTQETDAAVVVVSEESGAISLGTRGALHVVRDAEDLEARLLEFLRR